MRKAWGWASAVIPIGAACFFASLYLSTPVWMAAWVLVPLGAGVAASFHAPEKKFRVGALTFIPTAAILFATATFAATFGKADALDTTGTIVAIAFSLPIAAGIAALGAWLGERISGEANA